MAYELASLGHRVAVFEQKSAPGVNACCTGIISTACFQSLNLSPDVILTRVNSAKFFSPSGRCLRLETEEAQAYVVNRLLLDTALASKAQSQGAQYFFSSPVIDIIPGKDSIRAETLCSETRKIYDARAVIVANGFRPKLPHRLGLGRIRRFLVGAQAEIEVKNVGELEIYFGQKIAPGAFAWLVPTSPNKAHVGLLATSQARLHLQKFLDFFFGQGRITSREAKIQQKAIPMGTLARSYGDRVLVIGDAAGQVKPTTGGGIYFGHLGTQIAVQVLNEALQSDDLSAERLARYHRLWKMKMGKELSRGYWARWAFTKLGDRQIEGIFNAVDSNGLAQALLKSGNFSFDWHSRLVLSVLKHSSVYPFLKIRHLFSREAEL
jgi:geranylgeranyl reductase family protein